MSEHWKSTPRYWCKHCSTYVRDTKLERLNHESTAKHQSAVKRSLRDLHRSKEHEERDKERAKREIERLNGVVSGTWTGASTAGGSSSSGGAGAGRAAGVNLSETERKRQAEQLASLGVSIPQEFRGDMAMVGEWTVTSTTIVEDKPKQEEDDISPEARARGVHKRERTEEEKEEEDAIKGLFKKPRRWGRDSKVAATGTDDDLDTLLSGGLVVKKKEEDVDPAADGGAVKKEEDTARRPIVKAEVGEDSIKQEHAPVEDVSPIKQEPTNLLDSLLAVETQTGFDTNPDIPVKSENAEGVPGEASDTPVVAFKKRKPKHIRQK